jgi:hypothetical protein
VNSATSASAHARITTSIGIIAGPPKRSDSIELPALRQA